MATSIYKLQRETKRTADDSWEWSICVEAGKAALNKIDSVVYEIPFPENPVREVYDSESRFRLSDVYTAAFTANVEIRLKDGTTENTKINIDVNEAPLTVNAPRKQTESEAVKPTSGFSIQSIVLQGDLDESFDSEESETLTLDAVYTVRPATRAGNTPRHVVPVVDEAGHPKVIEFTFRKVSGSEADAEIDTDTVWIGDLTTIDDIFPGTSTQVRGIENGQGRTVVIPAELSVGESNRSGMLPRIALKLVRIFTRREKVEDSRPQIEKAVRDLAIRLEDQQLDNRTGLFRLTEQFELEDIKLQNGGNYLLFIHGTMSSAKGAFDKLKDTPVWTFINQTYENRVLAFQHKTLTQSPLENVLELVKELPKTATLTLISHSRGGLVGDILNRFCLSDTSKRGFSLNEKNYLRRQNRDNDLRLIEEIDAAISNKNITIAKFIRVASTASGTTLLSHRLDTFFNVIANVIGLAILPAFGLVRDLIATVLESRQDVSILPGLEVQSPGSPFNQMLNNANPDVLIDTPLFIISGDAKLSLRWQAIKVALTNLFFLGDNDFVVDTRSMYNGIRRVETKVQYFFDQGANVNHSGYFENDRTRNALLLALRSTGDAPIPGFSKLDSRTFSQEEIRNISSIMPGGKVAPTPVSGTKPIVVLLPGIMGSTLTVNGKSVWINYLSFLGGGLTSLLHNNDNNRYVKADGLVGSAYKKLADALSRDYDVVVFPFDWRIDMATNAAALDRKLMDLKQVGQPVKLIAHSMGGVLVRDYIIRYADNWKLLQGIQGFRLLLLGAPLGGSFRIPYVLFGLDSLIHTLDFIDVTHSKKELLAVFSQFPGILSLLPLTTDKENDFASRETWERMRAAFGDTNWPIPGDTLLDDFKNYREDILKKAATIDLSQAVYIAGQSRMNQQTISGFTTDNNRLTFLATKEGDESVTWASGIPQQLVERNAVYYSDVAHGELANEPRLFGAIRELLDTGITSQLKRVRPVVRSLEREFKAKTIVNFDLSSTGVEKVLMGLSTNDQFATSDVPITVSVSNGDLKYAMHPLMIGHFEGDGIISAEKAVNWHLGGELSRRHRLGLYPGPIGTSERVASGSTRGFRGAIIVGLGKQGLLTEYLLTSTVEQGTSKYLVNINSKPDNLTGREAIPERVGISMLIIGSGYGGLRIENSVRAIIQGVQNANTKVRQIYDSPKLIDEIEFVELYKDKALTCIKAISAIEKDESRSLNIFRNSNKIKELTGLRERLPIDDMTEWWTRINVSCEKDEFGLIDLQRNLQFEISTDAARVESQPLSTMNNTLASMLEDLSRKDEWSADLAKAVFELMIPNSFKEQVKRQNNINWILDSYTAAFPWELLQDSGGNARPLSVNAGMVRQLSTGNTRANITPVLEPTAIVIGDPDLGNPAIQLKAALEEGKKVADLLKTQGFEVNSLLNKSASTILLELFSRNYRIIHLAGHGVFNPDPKAPTGMLIGKDAYLTPAYIKQMSNVPELVFVNCCFLGQFDGAAELANNNRLKLAANIGTQLIEIGVKAVVVAGWAVNDTAALDFAEVFYQSMFEGYSFGEAIKKARKLVFEKHGARNNTWGAYQAYGDPFYRLLTKMRLTKPNYNFVIPQEAEIELSNLLNRVESGGYDLEEVMQTMDAIDKALIRESLSSGRIIELQALLFSGLNMYDQAVTLFEKLWKEEKASFSFSATEKFCNTKAKYHVRAIKNIKKESVAVKPEVQKQAEDAIHEVILKMKGILCFGETAERINILAGTYKRLAQISNGQDKLDAYVCSANTYKRSYYMQGNKTKFYPLINWLSIENALVLANARKWEEDGLAKKEDLQGLLKTELDAIGTKDKEEKDFWDWISEATILLCQRLLGDKTISEEALLASYTTGWGYMGSQGQHQAEIEHLDFLEDALSITDSEKTKDSLAVVRRIKMTLEGMM
ncbi:CHAT domain-containing protein [Spirosoma linguale]|uniref:CHAT domain-containing protein n=1 Tax=Spirosoma linguale (strain ATCC 33905 / DSM 74 / LMG 10896 / Claus 1) TaxID=504472 RepID=D2QG46_SPILD|nr:conserved hypothetical protein [Spirosoma linguale DSM 74]